MLASQNHILMEDHLTHGRPHAKSLSSMREMNANFPPPKTDKPRPHICATCTRGFARLEHLKRHERSHTKEKPFACEQCKRCFARRDLLLRHQQKLHMTAPPTSRVRGTRRESSNSAAPGAPTRIRKNSIANAGSSGPGSMRPRANTISHVDNATLGLIAASNAYDSRSNVNGSMMVDRPGVNGLPGVSGYNFRGMSTAPGQHGNPHVLPRLETRNHNVDTGLSLHTAPANGNFGAGIGPADEWCPVGSTVNPAQLHYTGSPHTFAFDGLQSPFGQEFSGSMPAHGTLEGNGHFPWLDNFENQMSFYDSNNEQAIEASSPSDSDGSPDGLSEIMYNSPLRQPVAADIWHNPLMSPTPTQGSFMDLSQNIFPDVYSMGPLSPSSMNPRNQADTFYSTPSPMPAHMPTAVFPEMNGGHFQMPRAAESVTTTTSAPSISSSNRQSSMTSASTDSINDTTRDALLSTLTQQSIHGYSNFKTSQPHVSSPLSPGLERSQMMGHVPLPSTAELQRFVGAYIQYFHPHLPFIHVQTLSFDSPAFTNTLRTSGGHSPHGRSEVAGGGGALILAMASIGALYEYEPGTAKELFDMSRTMIRMYTGERRRADMYAASGTSSEEDTPLWLVQALLLNVIYGHNCGDKTSAGIATTLCAAVIKLARSANLVFPVSNVRVSSTDHSENGSFGVTSSDIHPGLNSPSVADLQAEWSSWKIREERKRTLYAIFIMSSLLVSAYNHAPALTNSEIRLDLPCHENLWAAQSAASWKSLGGSATQDDVPFANALTSLLTAHQRIGHQQHDGTFHPLNGATLRSEDFPEIDFEPSTFGSLILINALHNYIWETRQRHAGLEWTSQETEALHSRVEPALRAWQAAWSTNHDHSIQRPNPFGASSLSADCIPLLDLAYLRLFVNLGKSREAFFKRDWDAMAEELANGKELVQHMNHSAGSPPSFGDSTAVSGVSGVEEHTTGQASASKRERHLRKAAFYAAHSLVMSDKMGVTFADLSSRELPLQSALCAFDCAQVVAEWASTLQQRLGPHLGILAKDDLELQRTLTSSLLEHDDIELLSLIDEITENMSEKLASAGVHETVHQLPSIEECSYGAKLLRTHARMFEQASIWPLTCEIAHSLRVQAAHIEAKAESSCMPIA